MCRIIFDAVFRPHGYKVAVTGGRFCSEGCRLVFSSPEFLFIFLPVTCALALITRKYTRAQNFILAIMSVTFYAWGNPSYVLLLFASVFINFLLARFARGKGDMGVLPGRKVVSVVCVVFNISLLGVFKYANFIVWNLNRVPGVALPDPGILLPIGISFFTFQAMSYVLDVCSGRIEAQNNFISLLLYISFFPQLIAGPIVRYSDIGTMLIDRSPTLKDAAYGLRRFIFGLSKKLLVANTVGAIADAVFGVVPGADAALYTAGGTASVATIAGPISCPVAWIGAIAYTLQIYYDFSGYSDMAIGLGRIFGFHFIENFNYPYTAVSIGDFWRRWHISLSTWFRDYVYIPLGGNRRGKKREVFNKTVVFFLTGLWHGASWTFVVWGLFHGLFLTLESAGAIPTRKMPKPAAWIYSMLVVVAGFVIFRSQTLAGAGRMLSAMFFGVGGGDAGAQFAQALSLFKPSVLPVIITAIAAMFPIKTILTARAPGLQAAGFVLSVPLFVICVLNLATQTYNPFIYYRF